MLTDDQRDFLSTGGKAVSFPRKIDDAHLDEALEKLFERVAALKVRIEWTPEKTDFMTRTHAGLTQILDVLEGLDL